MNFYYIPIRVAALAQSDTAVGNKVMLKNIKTTPKNKLYTLLPEFWEDNEQ